MHPCTGSVSLTTTIVSSIRKLARDMRYTKHLLAVEALVHRHRCKVGRTAALARVWAFE